MITSNRLIVSHAVLMFACLWLELICYMRIILLTGWLLLLIWYERKTLLAGWLTNRANRVNGAAASGFSEGRENKRWEWIFWFL